METQVGMTKMNGKSKDLLSERITQLKELIPEAFIDGKIDFNALKSALGNAVDSTRNHYSFTWNQKEEYRAFALYPSMGTLRPCAEESVGKDGTPGKFDSENIYIEGDNLEVLKLLQGSYYGKVKMIYIDPPYNTGKDFVYADNFTDSIGNYKEKTGQTDSEGNATRSNPETNGRYHTDWLNMMFPRLLLARNLLRDDGVIFISIDDNEVTNLRKLCDEIFGEENCIGQISVINNLSGRSDAEYFATCNEFLLVYTKSIGMFKISGFEISEEEIDRDYSYEDKFGHYKLIQFRKTGNASRREDRPYEFYPILEKDGKFSIPFDEELRQIYNRDLSCFDDEYLGQLIKKYQAAGFNVHIPKDGNGILGRWRWQKEKFIEEKDYNIQLNSSGTLCTKQRATLEDGSIRLKSSKTVFYKPEYVTGFGIRSIFDESRIFDNPKSLAYLSDLVTLVGEKKGIVLDFFAGSSTTAHAVMQLNAKENDGERKFIMVQLPEPTYEVKDGKKVAKGESKAAFEAGYDNICEIGKERIRRAAKKIKEDYPLFNGDLGFKVFKLDTSNFIPWNPNPENFSESLLAVVENVIEGRTMDDILYEVLIKCNLPLTLPIVKESFGENTINVIGDGVLMICLDRKISETVADEMVRLRDEKYKPNVPMQVVFLDNGFTDKDKANAIITLKQAGVEEKAIISI